MGFRSESGKKKGEEGTDMDQHIFSRYWYMSDPRRCHWNEALRVLLYLNNIKDLCIT